MRLVSLCSHRMSKVNLWEVWKAVGEIEQVSKNVSVKGFEVFVDVLWNRTRPEMCPSVCRKVEEVGLLKLY